MHHWTEEEINELRRLRNDHTIKEIAEIMGLSYGSVRDKVKRIGLRITREVYNEHLNKSRNDLHPKEGIQWLKDNQSNYNTTKEMLPDYNAKFGKNINLNALNRLLFANGIKRGKELCERYHQQRQGKHNPYRERYKIGDEIVRAGYVYVKVADHAMPSADKKKQQELWNSNWKLKQVKIFEEHHKTKVGKNDVVIFLDGDKRNFDVENLCCINRAIAGCINGSGLSSKGIVTKAGIEVISTLQILNNLGGETDEHL